jgi:hypothetical protein
MDKSLLGDLLAEWLTQCDRQRLHLTLASRTFSWAKILEELLQELFRDFTDPIQLVCELAPLRRRDVVQLAEIELGGTSEQFMVALRNSKLQPFAMKPLTLKSLLRQYKRTGGFPHSVIELYAANCETLSAEQNSLQVASAGLRPFTSKQLVAASTRIAAVSVFCAKDISREPIPAEPDSCATRLDALVGGRASFLGQECEITRAALGACLDTGLFSSRDSEIFGFAHQAYAEYLAAQYLIERQCTLPQIVSLIFNSNDPHHRLVPSLQGVAAWLSSQRPDVFDKVVKSDPIALFLSSLEDTCREQKNAIVRSFLSSLNERTAQVAGVRELYSKLAHDGIADVFRTYFSKSANDAVRHESILIAEACKVSALASDLVDIANDRSDAYEIRTAALFALGSMVDSFDPNSIKHFVTDESPDDIRDDLKGHALIALCPKHISVHYLFKFLTPAKEERYTGAYAMFLAYTLPDLLTENDLLVALEWACYEIDLDRNERNFERLIDEIVLKSFASFRNDEFVLALGKLAVLRICKQYHLVAGGKRKQFYEEIVKDLQARRRLLSSMFASPHPTKREEEVPLLGEMRSIAKVDDFDWLIEQLHSLDQNWQQRVIELLPLLYSFDLPELLETIFVSAIKNELVQNAFGFLSRTVELGSEEEKRLKVQYENYKVKPPTLLSPPPAERLQQLLSAFDAGMEDRWFMICRELSLKPDSEHYENLDLEDVRMLPGWLAADADTRLRFARAAHRYVLQVDPSFAGGVQMPESAVAGYKGLVLLLNEYPEFLAGIRWERWVGIILSFYTQSSEANQVSQKLFDLVYAANSEVAIASLSTVIRAEAEHFKHLYVLHKLSADKRNILAAVLAGFLESGSITNQVRVEILTALLDSKSTDAVEWAHQQIERRSSLTELAAFAAANLIIYEQSADWKYVWQVIFDDRDFGRVVMIRAAQQSFHFGGLIQKLSDQELADLYLWLLTEFPPELENPLIAGSVGADSLVHNLRDSIPTSLQKRNSPSSCAALEYICSNRPGLHGIESLLFETQAELDRKNWRPVSPNTLIKLTDNSKIHLVQNAHELMEIVMDSLHSLQAKLKGEGSGVWALWNEGASGRDKKNIQPKEEKRLSHYVADHLNDKLPPAIFANCEVEIRHGQEADISIDAVSTEETNLQSGKLSVLIETKGLWNPKIDTDLEAQLISRYLNGNRCRHGIYLIGYFNCNAWDLSDWREKVCRKRGTLENIREFFEEQSKCAAAKYGLHIRSFVLDASLPDDVKPGTRNEEKSRS